jgi:hypothetical protein
MDGFSSRNDRVLVLCPKRLRDRVLQAEAALKDVSAGRSGIARHGWWDQYPPCWGAPSREDVQRGEGSDRMSATVAL